jgi:hypothetical protein
LDTPCKFVRGAIIIVKELLKWERFWEMKIDTIY